jgi:amino acid adenylation domain-containing protein/non-ribosomal peptide synthase protein (TIGR01720 family)
MLDDTQKAKTIEKYWLKKLSGDIPKITLPLLTDNKARYDNIKNAQWQMEIPTSITQILERISNHSDIALFIFFLSGLYVFLYRYTGIDDLVVGTVTPREEGIKDKILLCRNRVEGNQTLRGIIEQVRQNILEDFNYSDYSFGVLYQKLLTLSDSGDPELFNVALFYDKLQNKNRFLNQFDIIFRLAAQDRGLSLEVDYNANLYVEEIIQHFCMNLVHFFHNIQEKVNQKAAEVDILCEEERERVLYNINKTETEYPSDKTIHQLFEEQVERTPEGIAVVFEGRSLTYRQLNKRANRLAQVLRKKGVKRESIVCLLMDRSFEMVIAMLAIFKAGGAYLPINLEYPDKRIIYMLDESESSILLTTNNIIEDNSFTDLMGLNINQTEPRVTFPRPQLNFDSLPIPDRSLIDYEKYTPLISQAFVKNCISMQATRGCPYHCSYCCKVWPRTHSARSAENLIEEIKLYYDMGFKRFSFVEDIFNLDIKNTTTFFQLLIKNGLDVQLLFGGGLRGDILTPDYVDLMVEAGTICISMALETASPRLQKLIKKNLDIDKLRDITEYICSKHPHVITELFTMHGFPTETEEEAYMTLDFLKSLKWIDFPYINVLKVYPNTEMEKIALEAGFSKETIAQNNNLAWHDLPKTLPFDRSFTMEYLADFLNNYFFLKERLLDVLPHQITAMTEDEVVQKFPVKTSSEDGLGVLLLDISQLFSDAAVMVYDVVEPPIGLMYILTYCNERFGEKIRGKIAKSRFDFDSYESLKVLINEFKPDVIGIRSLTFFRDFLHKTVALIRQWGIDVPIIAGGPYASSDYCNLLLDANVDLVILGEGEETFAEVIGCIMENGGHLPGEEALEEIAGIAFTASQNIHVPVGKGCREIIMLDQFGAVLSAESGENLHNINQPNDLAYVMFTSGSTGRPKGVMVEHKHVINVLDSYAKRYNVQPGINVLQISDYTFDPSVEQIFGTLFYGGSVYLFKKELLGNKEEFSCFVEDNQIHIINFVPSMLKDLLFYGQRLKSLKYVISGGEKLEDSIKDKLLEMGYTLYNQYGPTETTIDALAVKCSDEPVTIGKPIANVRCYILDENMMPVPIGVYGELYIGGDSVVRGYLKREELTAERFLPDLFVEGERMYRTGDFCRVLPDENFAFLHRIDNQVKIRGYRIELEEIESQLLKHEDVKKAVVVVREEEPNEDGTPGEKYLFAFVMLKDPKLLAARNFEISELREYLRRELPAYMVPANFIIMEKFPVSASGKINRKALADLKGIDLQSEVEYAAPRNEIEEKLVELWQEILGLDKIGIHDNFFMIGGDSIKSIQIASRANNEGYKIEVRHIFQYPSIAELSSKVMKVERVADQSIITGTVPLTPMQRDFFENASENSHHFNHAVLLFSKERLEEDALRVIFSRIQEHHDSLRMTYTTDEKGEIIQTNHGLDYQISLQVLDLRNQADAVEILERSVNEIHVSIDLAKGPLMKLGLFHLDDGDRLLIVIHHLVIDGISWRILFEDIESLYQQYLSQREPGNLELPLKTDSFKLWSEKLSSYANSDPLLKEKSYWLELEAIPVRQILKDFEENTNYVRDTLNLSFSLDKKETDLLLTTVNEAFGTEINDILLAALGLAIGKTYGNKRLLVALEGHGREEILTDVNINRTTGWFTSVYPVSLDFSYALDDAGEEALSRQIIEVKESLRRVPNKGIGYVILEHLTDDEYKKDLNFELKPQVNFNYLGQFDTDLERTSFRMAKESYGRLRSPKTARKYELEFSGMIANNQLAMTIIYSKKQFKTETIQVLMDNFNTKLSQIIKHCSKQRERELTPSDFGYKELSIEEFDSIFE